MKHTHPGAFLSRPILCFVRDHRPTVEELVARLGGPSGQGFHLLWKHGIVVVEDEHVRLSRRYLSPDGQRFVWGSTVFHLDEDVIDFVRWGQQGPPMYSDRA